MGITLKTRKKLWGKSGGRCSICRGEIFEPSQDISQSSVVLGEEAHICGEQPGSARYDASMTDDERNEENNLVLLCPTDHTKIDKNEADYPVEKLRLLKSEHEKWVQDAIREQMPSVTFAELEVTVNYLIANHGTSDELISFIKPKEKIAKNTLSTDIENLITTGMGRVQEVKNYLSTNPDIYFADRLKTGLVEKYNEIKFQDLDSDSIFLELLKFASGNSRDSKTQASALAVIVYFFEACDIFEK